MTNRTGYKSKVHFPKQQRRYSFTFCRWIVLVVLLVIPFVVLHIVVAVWSVDYNNTFQDDHMATVPINAFTNSARSNADGDDGVPNEKSLRTTFGWTPPMVPKFKFPLQHKMTPDGMFHGYPVYYRELQGTNGKEKSGLYSQIQCSGGTFPTNTTDVDYSSWMYRSCRFSLLCFDLDQHEYVLYQDPKEVEHWKTSDHVHRLNTIDMSSSYLLHHAPRSDDPYPNNSSNTTTTTITTTTTTYNREYGVSLGGINTKWIKREIQRLQWFPRLVTGSAPTKFYSLPSTVVMIPYHSMAGFNPGHLIWDEFLPIYTLLDMFALLSSSTKLLLLRFTFLSNPSWATCEYKPERAKECQIMRDKFEPLLFGRNGTTSIVSHWNATLETSNNDRKSNLVCARHGLAGMGSITDHGSRKQHGWMREDYEITHNHGRGGRIWKFRNYLMSNMGLYTTKLSDSAPLRIIVSRSSSERKGRAMDFGEEIKALREEFEYPSSDVAIESYIFSQLSLSEQIKIANQAAIYITVNGGGAVTSMFVPNGASIILYHVENGGRRHNERTGEPAKLDWDFFNHLSYARVHWLPLKAKLPKDVFLTFIRHELDIIRKQQQQQRIMK